MEPLYPTQDLSASILVSACTYTPQPPKNPIELKKAQSDPHRLKLTFQKQKSENQKTKQKIKRSIKEEHILFILK